MGKHVDNSVEKWISLWMGQNGTATYNKKTGEVKWISEGKRMGRLLKKKGRCSIFRCGTFHVKQEMRERVREKRERKRVITFVIK